MNLSALIIETELEARAAAAMFQVTSLLAGGGDWVQAERNLEIANMDQQLSGGEKTSVTGVAAFDYFLELVTLPFSVAYGVGNSVVKSATGVLNRDSLSSQYTELQTNFKGLFDAFKNYEYNQEQKEKIFKTVAGVGIVGLTGYGVFQFFAWLRSPRVDKDPILREKRDEFYNVFNEQLKGAKMTKGGRKMTKKEHAIIHKISRVAHRFEKKNDALTHDMMKMKRSPKKSPKSPKRKLKGGFVDEELGGGDDDLDCEDFEGGDIHGGRKKPKLGRPKIRRMRGGSNE